MIFCNSASKSFCWIHKPSWIYLNHKLTGTANWQIRNLTLLNITQIWYNIPSVLFRLERETEDVVDSDFDIDENDEPVSDQETDEKKTRKSGTKAYKVLFEFLYVIYLKYICTYIFAPHVKRRTNSCLISIGFFFGQHNTGFIWLSY